MSFFERGWRENAENERFLPGALSLCEERAIMAREYDQATLQRLQKLELDILKDFIY